MASAIANTALRQPDFLIVVLIDLSPKLLTVFLANICSRAFDCETRRSQKLQPLMRDFVCPE
jgi:hypothetical protein